MAIRLLARVSFGLAAMAAVNMPAAGAPSFPRGEVTAKITDASGKWHYVLYLPRSYDGSRAYPILYILDPRGRAPAAAEVFREAAELHSYILASSFETLSDSAEAQNLPALRGMLTDTIRRLKVDERRIYLAGFSGTARFAVAVGKVLPRGTVAGIVMAGAGYPFHVEPRVTDGLSLYATAGNADSNWPEMMHFEKSLDKAKLRHVLETFPGGHDWPPPAIASRALGWFDALAMRDLVVALDPVKAQRDYAAMTDEARRLEGAGRLVDAAELWHAAARDFAGLTDVSVGAAAAARIDADARLVAAARRRARYVERDDADMAAAAQAFGMKDVDQAASFLRLDELVGIAQSSKDEELRASARRLLSYVAGQCLGHLAPPEASARHWDRVIFYLSLASRAQPRETWPFYRRAAVYARRGQRGLAVADLKTAIANGFDNRAMLDGEAAFAPLRSTAAFKALRAILNAK